MMDEPTVRAILATTEVTTMLMFHLVAAKAISPEMAASLATTAAKRLEPVSDGSLLPDLAAQWNATAEVLKQLAI